MIGFLSRKVKILWKIFQIESTTFQICAHSKHSHSKKSIIILAFCSLSRTFATNKRVLTMANRRKCGFNSYQLKAVFTSIKARFQVNWRLHLICDALLPSFQYLIWGYSDASYGSCKASFRG